MKKNLEILQNVVRFYFFPKQDQTNPFSIMGVKGGGGGEARG